MFYIFQENNYLDPELIKNIVAAIGFRNLVVHEYGNIDLRQVYHIAQQDIDDIERFAKVIIEKCDII